MTEHPDALLRAILRTDLQAFTEKVFHTLHPGRAFQPNWHIEAMCHRLQEVAEGRETRLLMAVPPRYLKSICTAVAFAAWQLGHHPEKKILVASYGSDLANRHALHCRIVMESPWYQRLFPDTRIAKVQDGEIITTRGGGRKGVSLGGATTGFGADILIIDDLMKAADAASATERRRVQHYYEETLYSRLNDKQFGPIIVIQQRLHEDDFAGYLIAKGNFSCMILKAIAEEDERFPLGRGRAYTRRRGEALFSARESVEVLHRTQREMGSAAFSAQYQQSPVSPEGNRVRIEWFGRYDGPIDRADFQCVIQSWDTALRPDESCDYSVCTTWGLRDGKWYLLDVFRERLAFPDLKRAVVAQRQRWRADRVLIEDAASGIPLVYQLRRERCDWVQNWAVSDSKEVRFEAQTAMIEAGEVFLPSDAPWLAEFIHEVRAFPSGRHDDQVDSMVQFLEWTRSGQAMWAAIPRDPVTGRLAYLPRPDTIDRPR